MSLQRVVTGASAGWCGQRGAVAWIELNYFEEEAGGALGE